MMSKLVNTNSSAIYLHSTCKLLRFCLLKPLSQFGLLVMIMAVGLIWRWKWYLQKRPNHIIFIPGCLDPKPWVFWTQSQLFQKPLPSSNTSQNLEQSTCCGLWSQADSMSLPDLVWRFWLIAGLPSEIWILCLPWSGVMYLTCHQKDHIFVCQLLGCPVFWKLFHLYQVWWFPHHLSWELPWESLLCHSFWWRQPPKRENIAGVEPQGEKSHCWTVLWSTIVSHIQCRLSTK